MDATVCCPTPSAAAVDRAAFVIRPYEAGDLLQAQALFAAGQMEYSHPMGYINHAIRTDMADPAVSYVAQPRSAFFCAVRASDPTTVLSIAGLRPLALADPEYYSECIQSASGRPPFDPDQTLELNRMVVAQSVRRCGLALRMLQRCVRHCRDVGCTGIHLSTLDTMRPAVGLYLSVGFTQYRVDKQNWHWDPRFQTETMRRYYEATGGVTAADATRTFIAADEVPRDEQIIRRHMDIGICYLTHLYQPVLPES